MIGGQDGRLGSFWGPAKLRQKMLEHLHHRDRARPLPPLSAISMKGGHWPLHYVHSIVVQAVRRLQRRVHCKDIFHHQKHILVMRPDKNTQGQKPYKQQTEGDLQFSSYWLRSDYRLAIYFVNFPRRLRPARVLGAFASFAGWRLVPSTRCTGAGTALPLNPRLPNEPVPVLGPALDDEPLPLTNDVTAADPRPVPATREPPSLRAHFCSRAMSCALPPREAACKQRTKVSKYFRRWFDNTYGWHVPGLHCGHPRNSGRPPRHRSHLLDANVVVIIHVRIFVDVRPRDILSVKHFEFLQQCQMSSRRVWWRLTFSRAACCSCCRRSHVVTTSCAPCSPSTSASLPSASSFPRGRVLKSSWARCENSPSLSTVPLTYSTTNAAVAGFFSASSPVSECGRDTQRDHALRATRVALSIFRLFCPICMRRAFMSGSSSSLSSLSKLRPPGRLLPRNFPSAASRAIFSFAASSMARCSLHKHQNRPIRSGWLVTYWTFSKTFSLLRVSASISSSFISPGRLASRSSPSNSCSSSGFLNIPNP